MYWAHILTTLSVVFLNVGVQIFFQPSTVSTELAFFFSFFDWADSFLKDFPFKGKHIDISLVALFN